MDFIFDQTNDFFSSPKGAMNYSGSISYKDADTSTLVKRFEFEGTDVIHFDLVVPISADNNQAYRLTGHAEKHNNQFSSRFKTVTKVDGSDLPQKSSNYADVCAFSARIKFRTVDHNERELRIVGEWEDCWGTWEFEGLLTRTKAQIVSSTTAATTENDLQNIDE